MPPTGRRVVRQKVDGKEALKKSDAPGEASSSSPSSHVIAWVTGRRGRPATIAFVNPNLDDEIDFEQLEAEGASSRLLHRQ